MKRRLRNVLFSVVTLGVVLFLLSCGPRPAAGDQPTDTAAALREVQSGTQGVEISFVPNAPPATLYDQNELIAILDVKNKGNYDLGLHECFIDVTGFDRNIISGDFGRPISCAAGLDVLEGKNVYNTQGGFNQLELRAPFITLPDNVYEYNPELNFVTCYNYLTRANPAVCVDPLFYEVTSEQKACRPQDVILGGGQGGPVGVTFVGVDMTGNRAIFEINVRNMGSGRVLSPDVDIQRCGQTSLEYEDLDRLRYDVEMPSGGPLDCKPRDGIVRLTNGQGKIICDYTIPQGSAFETLLQVELDYAYVQSVKKPVKIIATPR